MSRGETPRRSIRVDAALWRAAQARADEEGRTVTEVIVAALRRYARGQQR